jgi:hypothetical protein
MKKLLSIICILFCGVAVAQTQNWSAQFDVSGTGYNNVRPRIALMTDNTPIVLWGDDVNNAVYTATWNGSGFNTPVRVHSLNSDAFTSYWAGPEIAASGDTVFIGLKIMPEDQHGVYSVRSVDAGQTYDDTVRIDLSADSLTRFPTVAIAAGGQPVFAYMKFDINWMDPQYHVANSSDGGLTFNADVAGTALAPEEVCDCCPANVQIQGQRQVLTFRNNMANLRETWAAVSEDGGATFAAAGKIDTSEWIIFACPSTGPDAVLMDDQLTTVYMSAGSGKSKVYISETDLSNNFSVDFQSKLQTADPVTAQANYIRIAGGDDVIAAVWQHTEFGNANVYFTTSNSGAVAMADNIDTANISTDGLQQSPDIAYADGTFHIVWKDNDSGVVMYRSVTVPYTTSVGIGEGQQHALDAVLSPNPFSTSTTLKFDNPNNRLFSLRIYDIAGKLHREIWTNSDSEVISAEKLKPGTYFYVLTGANNEDRGKLLIH